MAKTPANIIVGMMAWIATGMIQLSSEGVSVSTVADYEREFKHTPSSPTMCSIHG